MIGLKDFKYLSREPDRFGNDRVYIRRYGRRIRIHAAEGTKEFAKAYTAALEKLEAQATAPAAPIVMPKRVTAIKGTIGWVAESYYDSDEFQSLDIESQRTRRSVIDKALAEPHSDDDPEPMRNCPLPFFTSVKVKRLRDLKAKQGVPGAANNRRKYISAMCGWAIEAELMKSNPARDVRRKKYATNGFYTWTLEDLRVYLERHGVGTKARLLMGLLLFLGVRRSDVVRLGPPMVTATTIVDKDGVEHVQKSIKFVPKKTSYHRLVESEKPILPVLDEIIATSPCGKDTFLETFYGKPFTAKGLGNYMRDRCDEAGLRMCTAHGLRKLGATVAAELQATEHQLMAMFDWSTPQQAAVYTREARRRLLAQGGMPLLSGLGIGLHPPSNGVH